MDINQVLTVRERNSGVISHLHLVVDNDAPEVPLPIPFFPTDEPAFDFGRLDERTSAA